MNTMNGTGVNPKDPLWKSAPERVEHLTKQFGKEANGFSIEDVVNASAATLITALRQAYSTKGEAESRFNELFGRMLTLLLTHYDGSNNRVQGAFPFNQAIYPNVIKLNNHFPN